MYVYQSATGWELEFLTSRSRDEALRRAARTVTGQGNILPSYNTRAAAEAAMAEIYEVYAA